MIEYAVNFAKGEWITAERLRDRIHISSRREADAASARDLKTAVRIFQKQLVKEAIARYGEDPAAKERAAEELGISRATLYRILSQVMF